MKINLYQRQHPTNLTHVMKPSMLNHTPYSMTSSNSSIDFPLQQNAIYQIAICEEPIFIIKGGNTPEEKHLKIRLKLDKGILQFTEVRKFEIDGHF